MSNQSANLQLTFLAQGQAQKHVSVNESLLRLDVLVQMAAESASSSVQPGAPADGALYIVPPGKSGVDWAALANGALAYYRDGAWEEIAPREGWLAYVKDAAALLCFDGADWRGLEAVIGALPVGGGVLGGNLALSKATPILQLTDTAGPTTFSIFNLSGSLYIERPGGGNALAIGASKVEFGAHLLPGADNVYTLGDAAHRLSVVYAATGAINTSDAREKTPLRSLTAAERAAIARVIAGIGVFQWLASVAEKGPGGARLHVGVTAQAVLAAFAAEGLDARNYGLFCADPTADGDERLGVRTDQVLLMALAMGV